MPNSPKELSRTEIWKMFDSISTTYDKTNRWITLGLDLYWRKKVASFLPLKQKLSVLDCATGTADQILSLMRHSDSIEEVFGIDLSESMLQIGKEKIRKTRFSSKVDLRCASALNLPFPENRFDCATLSFGIRNVTNVDLCLKELLRVIRPGGRVLILETSLPKLKILRALHLFYIRKILPLIGGWISKKKKAYQYLNQTAETFPCGKDFCKLMHQAGFEKAIHHPMTFGAVSIYIGEKCS